MFPRRIFTCSLCAIAGFVVSVTAHAAPENLALHRDYVSSAPNTHGWDKPGLTDGVRGDDSSTCYATDESATFPKTVSVDLGAVHSLSTIVLAVPSFGSTKTVEVSVSTDNAVFTPFGSYVFRLGEVQRAVVTGQAQARYVRLTYPDHYAETRGGYDANFAFTSELEVYDGPAPVEDPAAAATTPAVKDLGRHQQFLERVAVDPNVGLLFLGDSITDGWPRNGESSWLKFAPYHPADFGIGGDRTEHVLWRITHGELDGIHPKVAVIMIGTNNAGRGDIPATEAAGITKVVETVRAKLPQTKILLLAVFPREGHDAPNRRKNTEANVMISKLANGQSIRYLDIGSAFLDANGDIPRAIMPDGLHPNAKGYELWYQAMWPTLQEMLR